MTSSSILITGTPSSVPAQDPSARLKEKLRAKVLESFADLIEPEVMDQMISSEIQAFFKSETLLTVQPTSVEVDNPSYNPQGDYWSASNKKTLTRECMAFGSKMTPFRQLVWSTLHQHLMPVVVQQLRQVDSDSTSALNDWVVKTLYPELKDTHKDLFTMLALGMAQTMFRSTLDLATKTARVNLEQSFASVGLDASKIPSFPAPLGAAP